MTENMAQDKYYAVKIKYKKTLYAYSYTHIYVCVCARKCSAIVYEEM